MEKKCKTCRGTGWVMRPSIPAACPEGCEPQIYPADSVASQGEKREIKPLSEIMAKIAEHQKWIDDLIQFTEDRDDSFWFDLQRLRNGQKALEWVICPNPLLEPTDIDRMLEWESTCKYASRIF